MEKQILQILKDILPQGNYENEEQLMDKGIIDSVDFVTIVARLTAEFNVSFQVEDFSSENFNSVKNIAELITRKRVN